MRLSKSLFVAVVLLCSVAAYSQTPILAENFRNTDCLNCRVPDDNFEKFLKENPKYKVVLVNIHTANPFPSDPFFLSAKNDVNARAGKDFYDITSNPTMVVSGFNAGPSVDSWKNYVKESDKYPLPAELTVTKTIDPYKLITVKIRVDTSYIGRQVRPVVYLLESNIKFWNNKTYGNFPDTLWHNVLRAVAPSGTGGDPFMLGYEKDIEITYDASAKNWNMDNVSVVVFLQDVEAVPGTNDRPIFGLTETTKGFVVGGACGDECTDNNAISPIYNINDNSASLKITIAKPASVKIILSDMLGIEAATVYNGFASANTFTAELPTDILPAGMYFARMFVGGMLVDVKKILVNR